ncbi:hypothetical protein WME91_38720 [Sorangium sp. So ce269]
MGAWKIRDRADVSFEDHARFVYHAGMERVLLVSGRPNRGVFSGDGRDWSHVADASSRLFMQGGADDEAHDRVVVLSGLAADRVGADRSRSTSTRRRGRRAPRTRSRGRARAADVVAAAAATVAAALVAGAAVARTAAAAPPSDARRHIDASTALHATAPYPCFLAPLATGHSRSASMHAMQAKISDHVNGSIMTAT